MILTEEEYREKWCPHVRLPDGSNVLARCTASECSQWRWSIDGLAASFDDDGMVLRTQNKDEEIRGYCGLAGKP